MWGLWSREWARNTTGLGAGNQDKFFCLCHKSAVRLECYLTFLDPFFFIDVPLSLLCYDSMPWLYIMVIEMCVF